MKKHLTRYWFESQEGRGIGVTAYNIEDAIKLITNEKAIMSYKPILTSYKENINIQELDQNHVIPNMGICINRGIWFPSVK